MQRKRLVILCMLTFIVALSACGQQTPEFLSPIGEEANIITEHSEKHIGTDFGAEEGTPILACYSGEVTAVYEEPNEGHIIELESEDGHWAKYYHCMDVTVQEGDTVKTGDPMALVQDLGEKAGPHVHVEIKDADGNWVDPAVYLELTAQ